MAPGTEETLEREALRMFELLDAMNLVELSTMFTDDAQAVDEITGGWTRGRAGIEDHIAHLEGTVSGLRSRLTDLAATVWDDAGLVTCILHQTYTMDDTEQSVSAPTSFVFRREAGAWKVSMLHSVPVAE